MDVHNSRPGPIPAINSFPIDRLAMEPYRIAAIPGGINGVMIDENAVTAEENGLLYPWRSISGSSILASMAASAREEPDRPPIIVDSSTFTCARPPGSLQVSTVQKSIIRFVTPV